MQGILVEGERYAGGPCDWLTAFAAMTGAALLHGYALLANAWLFWRSCSALQQKARAWTPVLLAALLTAIAAVSV